MNTIVRVILVSVMLMVAAPAYSASATQVFFCEEDDDATEEDLKAAASKWLKAARGMKGGENLEAQIFFPIAVTNMGETDFLFVVTAPSFEEWGQFWDGYEGSEAARIDDANREHAICPESALWETVKVK